ncbi:DUF389 domain-containing protein [Streptomyces sp. YC504]|uniref:DUF389 domain-containing protein n=1 Tax=Streptomyces mesophilus TaxID=1775132 RepID=A0A6G4XBJ0_9ACTN|nr:DUF389 domain-containing protein [Streptomyces mesophilus]NGO74207.1 DUF389 domain-containing protein [Streptomyces mesophilus]
MEMLRVRLAGPPELVGRLAETLHDDPYAFDLAVQRATGATQTDDVVECHVLAGAANQLLRELRALGAGDRVSLTVEPVALASSATAEQAERRLLGPLARAPVWELVRARIHADGIYRPSFYLLLVAAGVIGAVGILTNSQILVVGAMVVGPEYGAIANIALGLNRWDPHRVGRAVRALVIGFALAVAATFAFAALVRAFDLQPLAYENGVRPVSHMVGTPNFYSLVVAVAAGVVGVVSLTLDRSATLLGVFISATTIPAAADMGVAWAFGSWDEGLASAGQLGLNLLVLIVAGALTLFAQQRIWRRIRERPADVTG